MKLERISHDLFRCAPLPDWIDCQPYRADIPDTEDSCVAGGIRRLLNDVQVDLGLPELAWHCRTAQRVLTREGAQRVAHVVAEFDPGYQRIEMHFVRVVRDGEIIEHAKPEAFQLLRRETNLERLVFDGVLTASLLIPDVRIGDIVEIGVTVYGSVPVLGGRYVGWAIFDSFSPWFENRYRLMRPHARHLALKAFNDPPQRVAIETAEMEDLRWQIVGQKRREPEPLTPSWFIQRSCIQLSEFKSWSEVACLLEPHYAQDVLPEALVEEIDRLAIAYADPAVRAVEWLRFVQREIRYFAISLGEGGLTPRPLDSIWGTRFGDCKDAATLYAAGARRLGLDACPALVSTTHGFGLEGLLPSSGVFDHCIVRLSLGGKQYWLDPTMPVQSGTLDRVFQPHAGWALPLTPATAGLEKIGGDAPMHVIHWEDELQLGPKRESPATLLRHIDCFSWVADGLRNRMANEGSVEYARGMLKELQADWPGTTETKPIEIRDDPAQNCLSVTLSYRVPDCWQHVDGVKGLSFRITDPVLSGELASLRAVERQTAIFLGRPRRITRHVRMTMARNWGGDGWWRESNAPGLEYTDRLEIVGSTIENSKEFVVSAWSIPAGSARRYDDLQKDVRENVLIIPAREQFGRIRPLASELFGLSRLQGAGAFGLLAIIIWVLLPLLKALTAASR